MLIRTIVCVVRAQLQRWLRSPKAWIAFLMGMLIQANLSVDYLGQAAQLGYPIQITESFLLMVGNRAPQFGLIVAIALLFSDVPCMDGNAPYIIFRTRRTAWILGIIVYLLIGCFLYFLMMLLTGMLISAPSAFANNTWSPVIWILARRPDVIGMRLGYFIDLNTLNLMRPYQACLVQVVLLSLYGFSFSLVMLVINLRWNRGIGFAVAMLLHGVMLELHLDGHPVGYWLSLFTHASVSAHFSNDAVPLYVTGLIFSAIGLCGAAMAIWMGWHMDIRNTTSPYLK